MVLKVGEGFHSDRFLIAELGRFDCRMLLSILNRCVMIRLSCEENKSNDHSSFSSKKLLGAKGIATRNKNATRGSWPYY